MSEAMKPAPSAAVLWVSRVLSGLVVGMLVLSAAFKVSGSEKVAEGFARAGFSLHLLPVLAAIELTCALLYAIPRTAVLGAILVTGYFGGAIVTHLRAGETALVTPLLLGVLAWAGLFLRDARVRALIPLRARG